MTTRADSKKRIVIPTARSGDVFDLQTEADGRYVLVRLERPRDLPKKTREECLAAIDGAPLKPRLSWEELRAMTR